MLVNLFPAHEALDLNGIAAGIAEEHGRLFADLTLESNVGLDHELRAE